VFFLLQSILCQLIGFGGGLLFREVAAPTAALSPGLWPILLAALHALIAWGLSVWLRLPRAWQLFNLLAIPAALLYLELELPAGVLLAALIVSVLIYLPTLWTRVPWYPTHPESYARIAAELPTDRPFTFIDLGCGFGRLLTSLARARPNGRFTGVEISPLPWLIGVIRARLTPGRNAEVKLQSLWRTDLGQYDVVYAFLAPGPMPELWRKVQRECRPSTVFMTNAFSTGSTPAREIPAGDTRGSMIYVHLI